MTPDTPRHNNPETTLEEPVYLFTDKAIVPPSRQKGTPSSKDQQPEPPGPAPEEESGK